MARRNDLSRMARDLRAAIEAGAREAVAAVHGDLIKGSPVDTGRFRASWFHVQSPGKPDTDEAAEPGRYGSPPSPVDPSAVDPRQNQAFINNLPYATRLCLEGWSKKAPADWFTRIGDRWTKGAYLDEAFQRTRRGLR